MSCILCNNQILKSGKVRPNVATFECGHEYHLSCILSHSKLRCTEKCPQCFPDFKMGINMSTERYEAIESLVLARRKDREIKLEKTPQTSLNFGWFNNENSLAQLVSSGTSLNTLRIKGHMPEDFIEHQISWKRLADIYNVDALLEFGCKWHHMILMGFMPDDFKSMTWQQLYDTLQVRAPDMLKTSINVRQLGELKFSIQQIKQLGFTWKDFMNMDGNVKTLKSLTSNLSDLKTYFNPNNVEWEKAGFTRERINLYKWVTDEFTPVRQTRQLTLKTLNRLDF